MKKILVGIVILLVITIIGVQVMSTRSIPVIKEIAKKEMERFCQLIVNHATIPYDDTKELMLIERDNNQQITVIAFDMPYITKIAGEIVLDIEALLLSLEEGIYKSNKESIYNKKLQEVSNNKGIIASFPMGLLANNPFLANVGPNINIKYKSITQVSSSIDKEIKNYGINHIMVELYIIVTIKLQVVAPFYQEEYTQKTQFPLCLEIIEGQVPQWYQN
jgi:sporulation protein YunB